MIEGIPAEVWNLAAQTEPARLPRIIEHSALRKLLRPVLFWSSVDIPVLAPHSEESDTENQDQPVNNE